MSAADTVGRCIVKFLPFLVINVILYNWVGFWPTVFAYLGFTGTNAYERGFGPVRTPKDSAHV
jgi:hypothetical protein